MSLFLLTLAVSEGCGTNPSLRSRGNNKDTTGGPWGQPWLSCKHVKQEGWEGQLLAHLRHCLHLRAQKWCMFEFFYSDLDRWYFQNNDFEQCLRDMGIDPDARMTRFEWTLVRGAMGRPRRLSVAFLSEERKKLWAIRQHIWRLQHGVKLQETEKDKETTDRGEISLTPHAGEEEMFPPLKNGFFEWGDCLIALPPPISVGCLVLCIHPVTRTIQEGRVVATEEDTGRASVSFKSAGVWSVPVWECALLNSHYVSFHPLREGEDVHVGEFAGRGAPTAQRPGGHSEGGATFEVGLGILSELLRSLFLKEHLILQLKNSNDEVRTLQHRVEDTDAEPPAKRSKLVMEHENEHEHEKDPLREEMTVIKKEEADNRPVVLPLAFRTQYASHILDLDSTNRSLEASLNACDQWASAWSQSLLHSQSQPTGLGPTQSLTSFHATTGKSGEKHRHLQRYQGAPLLWRHFPLLSHAAMKEGKLGGERDMDAQILAQMVTEGLETASLSATCWMLLREELQRVGVGVGEADSSSVNGSGSLSRDEVSSLERRLVAALALPLLIESHGDTSAVEQLLQLLAPLDDSNHDLYQQICTTMQASVK